ncbi:MAG: IS66 family transposase [Planctomycetota bacterium]
MNDAEKIAALLDENRQQAIAIKQMEAQINLLYAKIYGSKSEALDPGQLYFDSVGESSAVKAEKDPEASTTKKSKSKAKGHGRAVFPDHLERELVELELSECERSCQACGEHMRDIGVDVSERGELIPARVIVKQYRRHRYACPNGHSIVTAPAAPGVIERAKNEASVYAHIATKKYADHMPLSRLEGIFKRQGFRIPKQTMWDMVKRTAELMTPIYEVMKAEVLASKYIKADETTLKVAINNRKNLQTGFLWAYRGKDKVVYDFTLTRVAAGPTAFLAKFSGLLQADGYSGYNEICAKNGITRAGCWAHARRKFVEALPSFKVPASLALIQINRLFRIEALLRERRAQDQLADEAFFELRKEIRLRFSRRVLARLLKTVGDMERRGLATDGNLLGKAVTYIANQKKLLEAFLLEPVFEIDNNEVERDMKHIAVGRKNWNFAGSEAGAAAGATIFSIVASCKAMEIDPEAYLADVLPRLETTPVSELGVLTPWGWANAEKSEALDSES